MTTKMDAELSPEAKAVIEQKQLKGRRRYSQWLPLLRELERFDLLNDAAIKKTKKLAGRLGVSGFILLIISFFAPMILALTIPLAIGLIIGAVTFGIKAKQQGSLDLENDLRLTLNPFLEAIREDILPKGKIGLELHLLNTINKENKQPSRKLPTRFRKLVETPFRQQTCSAKVPLVNGSTLLLEISREALRLDRTYTSRSGKIKSKRKWKLIITVVAGLIPDGETIRFDESAIGDLANEEKVKQKGEVCLLVRRFKFKSINHAPPEQAVEPAQLIAMFMTLCKALKSSKEKEA